MMKILNIEAITITYVAITDVNGDNYRVWPNYPDNDVEMWDIDIAAFVSVSDEELRQSLIDASSKFFNEDGDNNEPYPIA